MIRRLMTVVSIGVVAIVLSGCGSDIVHFRTVRANYNVSRGAYQPAIVDYLKGKQNAQFAPWLAYNLGNVYHYLGESGAAIEQWEEARNSGEVALVYGSAFNYGVYLYEQGRFPEALGQFRSALEINPGSRPAKINVELTLEKINAEAEISGEGGGASNGGERTQTEAVKSRVTRTLDYVRRKEEQRWRANDDRVVREGEEDW